ncbi:hypothetical protein DXG01_000843, partial [Tephrocybe rancida]
MAEPPQLLMRDPNLDVCPDFSSAPFEPTCALMRATGMTDEEAVTSLQEAWTTHNNTEQDRWEQETEARNAAAAQVIKVEKAGSSSSDNSSPRQNCNSTDEELTERERKARLKLRAFNPQMRVGNTLAPRPSSYAINKLSNFEYCELWYFSMEGCEDALRTQQTEADDSASKRVIQDEELSWEHPFVTRENGKKVLLVYAARVCRDWMDLMKGGGDVFNIALINDELLESVSQEIQSKLTADLQRQ